MLTINNQQLAALRADMLFRFEQSMVAHALKELGGGQVQLPDTPSVK